MDDRYSFTHLAKRVARAAGQPTAFGIAVGLILVWAATGPIFHYSDTWQLVVNTATTIVTFLMVFLIQNTQNRDTAALQLKLDELIRALEGAHNSLLDLEELTDEELDQFRERYGKLARRARTELKKGLRDTHGPAAEDSRTQKSLDSQALDSQTPMAARRRPNRGRAGGAQER
jgi:low affinity Fe/Cu permease